MINLPQFQIDQEWGDAKSHPIPFSEIYPCSWDIRLFKYKGGTNIISVAIPLWAHQQTSTPAS